MDDSVWWEDRSNYMSWDLAEAPEGVDEQRTCILAVKYRGPATDPPQRDLLIWRTVPGTEDRNAARRALRPLCPTDDWEEEMLIWLPISYEEADAFARHYPTYPILWDSTARAEYRDLLEDDTIARIAFLGVRDPRGPCTPEAWLRWRREELGGRLGQPMTDQELHDLAWLERRVAHASGISMPLEVWIEHLRRWRDEAN